MNLLEPSKWLLKFYSKTAYSLLCLSEKKKGCSREESMRFSLASFAHQLLLASCPVRTSWCSLPGAALAAGALVTGSVCDSMSEVGMRDSSAPRPGSDTSGGSPIGRCREAPPPLLAPGPEAGAVPARSVCVHLHFQGDSVVVHTAPPVRRHLCLFGCGIFLRHLTS